MSKEMVISSNPHETRVAIMEEGQLCEYYVERQKEFALVGSIYKGRVTRVLPGMQSAFVEIGLDSDAFLYVSDFLEETEELDRIVTTVVDKVEKMEEQGGHVFAPHDPSAPALEPADVESGPAASPPAAWHEATASEALRPAEPQAPEHLAPASQQPPGYTGSSPDRPPYENRSRENRDLGRPGGRGRGGRFNRRGRGPGNRDRNYGHRRDLPPSKYAAPHASTDHSEEPSGAEGHVPIILPGESLAKYRDKPPVSSLSALPLVEESRESAPSSVSEGQSGEPEQVTPATTFQPRAEYRPTLSGIEPLPGESLSKWKRQELSSPVESEPAVPLVSEADAHPPERVAEKTLHLYENALSEHLPRAEAEQPEELHSGREDEDRRAQFRHEAEATDRNHVAAELSEDEAAAIAEHVAEAQIEEEAREAQRREFAASDETLEANLTDHTLAETLGEEIEDSVAEALDETEEPTESEVAARSEPESMVSPGDELRSEHLEAMEGEHLSSEGADPPAGGVQPPQQFNARVRNDFRSRMQYPRRDRGRRDDRGRRPQHGPAGHHAAGHGTRHTQPRRLQLIADLLKQGQEIIVQIAKEPLGKKGARITSHVALPGRYLVYMPTLDHTGVSRKIALAEDRARLRHLVNEAKGSAGGGFIVRTAAASAPPEDVRTDVEFLTRTWAEIKSRSEQRKAPSLLHRDLNLVERILRDYMSNDYAAIWVDSEEEFTKVVDFMSRFQPGLVNRVKLYTKETPVFEEFGIQQEIDKGLRPKVWLKSGGYIVINHTEALVAIDVNTGKFVGKGSNRLEDTIVRTNLEAVKEIVRQMRLRDLGGIIIIDFIDMEERRNREKVMAALEDALRADRAPSKMLRFNEFGLIAITRKRTKQALERTLCQPCPYCTGSGMVKSIPTLCYEIQTEARKMAAEIASGSITLRVHPEISKALKTREASLIEELENWTKKSTIIQADPTLHWEQYDIY
jgi:ribonuclease G